MFLDETYWPLFDASRTQRRHDVIRRHGTRFSTHRPRSGEFQLQQYTCISDNVAIGASDTLHWNDTVWVINLVIIIAIIIIITCRLIVIQLSNVDNKVKLYIYVFFFGSTQFTNDILSTFDCLQNDIRHRSLRDCNVAFLWRIPFV